MSNDNVWIRDGKVLLKIIEQLGLILEGLCPQSGLVIGSVLNRGLIGVCSKDQLVSVFVGRTD